MSSLKRLLSNFIVTGAVFFLNLAWNLPTKYSALKMVENESLKLDYVIIERNGELKRLVPGEELVFVRGDLLKVRDAYLKNSKYRPEFVELDSLEGVPNFTDLREKTINTAKYLTSYVGTVDSEGKRFPIVIRSKSEIYGVVYFRREEPVLSYIDVMINDKTRVMREGENIKLKRKDKFKVLNVVTNIDDNQNVTFRVVPLVRSDEKKSDMQKYEIVFRHKNYVFAKIPLTVESL